MSLLKPKQPKNLQSDRLFSNSGLKELEKKYMISKHNLEKMRKVSGKKFTSSKQSPLITKQQSAEIKTKIVTKKDFHTNDLVPVKPVKGKISRIDVFRVMNKDAKNIPQSARPYRKDKNKSVGNADGSLIASTPNDKSKTQLGRFNQTKRITETHFCIPIPSKPTSSRRLCSRKLSCGENSNAKLKPSSSEKKSSLDTRQKSCLRKEKSDFKKNSIVIVDERKFSMLDLPTSSNFARTQSDNEAVGFNLVQHKTDRIKRLGKKSNKIKALLVMASSK